MEKVFVYCDGQVLGPWTRTELFNRLATGEISASDQACFEGRAEWTQLSNLLRASASTSLFSAEKIAADAAERSADAGESIFGNAGVVKDSAPSEEARPSSLNRRRRALIAGTSIAAVAFIWLGGAVIRGWPTFGTVVRPTRSDATSVETSKPVSSIPRELALPSNTEQSVRRAAEAGPNLRKPVANVVVDVEEERDLVVTQTTEQIDRGRRLLNPHGTDGHEPVPIALSDERAESPKQTEANASIPELEKPDQASQESPINERGKLDPTLAYSAKDVLASKAVYEKLACKLASTVGKIEGSIARISSSPAGALVVFLPKLGSTDEFVRRREWHDLAAGLNLNLIALAVEQNKDPRVKKLPQKEAVAMFVESLRQALSSGVPDTLPLVVYGRYAPRAIASSFVQEYPDRIRLWAAYESEWPEHDKRPRLTSPATLICDKESALKSSASREFFKRGRLAGAHWSWLCVNVPWQNREASIDGYVRAFIIESWHALNANSSGKWFNVDTKAPFSSLDLMANAGSACWMPSEQLVEKWSSLMSRAERISPTIIQKTVATRNPKQPNLDLFLRMPSGIEPKNIKGVLAFCTWENNRASILNKLDINLTDKQIELDGPAGMIRSLMSYAEKRNLAVLTWGTSEVWNNRVSADELDQSAQTDFDRNFDLLSSAWERGVKEMCAEAGGIPYKCMLLYGMSRGAQWAHRLALRKPEYFLAVHIHIPSTFDKPNNRASAPLWLLTTGELEYGYERAQDFYQQCRVLGYPIIFKAIVGIGHQGSALADRLGIGFFDYALSVKSERQGLDARNLTGSGGAVNTTGTPWLKSFVQPQQWGDYVNQDCMPGAKGQAIPHAFRVPLPTAAIAAAWSS